MFQVLVAAHKAGDGLRRSKYRQVQAGWFGPEWTCEEVASTATRKTFNSRKSLLVFVQAKKVHSGPKAGVSFI